MGRTIEKAFDLANDGLNLAADGAYLYVRCLRTMYKYRLDDMSLAAQNTIFRKDGKARAFSICEKAVCLIDFCDFYRLDPLDLRIQEVIRLGADASSDLCCVRCDGTKAFISVRHGAMIFLDLETGSRQTVSLNDTTSWDHTVFGNRLYVGTVSGHLIEMDTGSAQLVRSIAPCKKNIYGVVRHRGRIYTVSQDTTIQAVDADTFEVVCTAKHAIKGMTRIVGIWNDRLVVADGGISLWDTRTLTLHDRFAFPTGHFNKGVTLCGDRLIGSDFRSIYTCEL